MSVQLVGVPTDFGANRRGVDMGPSAIRYAGLTESLASAGIEWVDTGDLDVPPLLDQAEVSVSDMLAKTRAVSDRLSAHLEMDRPETIPLVLGGDHSITLGSLNAVTDENLGVVWFDAHGDYNTPETSPSGHVHGMTLAAALGEGSFAEWARIPGLAPENVVLVGTRDLDEGEAEALRRSEVTVLTMSDIDMRGIADVCEQAIDIARDGMDAVHVSLDMDLLDPIEAPGVGTPAPGGVTYREAHMAMEIVARELTTRDQLAGMDVVEVNPIRDRSNKTAELATELVASAFGKRVL